MVESAALLVDEVLPHEPMRQWVTRRSLSAALSVAREPTAVIVVLRVVYRTIASRLIKQAGSTHAPHALVP